MKPISSWRASTSRKASIQEREIESQRRALAEDRESIADLTDRLERLEAGREEAAADGGGRAGGAATPGRYGTTSTPRQKATWSRISAAAGSGSG